MKRLSAVAILLLALPALGQIRGVPASVTSFGQGRGNTPGVPASVTSLGPNGFNSGPRFTQPQQRPHGRNFGSNFNSVCSTPGLLTPSAMGCTNPYFTNQMYGLPLNAGPTNLRSRDRNRGHGGSVAYPVYVPYAVPVVVEGEGTAPEYDAASSTEPLAEEPPAMTVFERRPKSSVTSSAVPLDESRVYRPALTPPAEPREERQAPPIVLIFKDGHQREVQNYAIVGAYLYDISGFSSQKILLADLNLKATIRANEERGVDFTLPGGVTP